MAHWRPHSNPDERKENDDMSTACMPTVPVRMPLPRFLCTQLSSKENTMKNISPFYIQRALDDLAGKVRNASRLRNGTLLVETLNERQSEFLLKATLLGSHPITVERHASLNTCPEVIKTDSLDDMSNEEIQTDLADQSVSKAFRLIGHRNGKPAHNFPNIRDTSMTRTCTCRIRKSCCSRLHPEPHEML
jgi:hypothetical protein